MISSNKIAIVKWLLILLCVSHFVYLTLGTVYGWLGANPVETLTHVTGEWGLRLLWVSLAITPLRRLFRWNVLLKFRRLLGVCSFVYISAHLSIFLVFDHFFDWLSIIEDIIDRPYITVGFAAYVLMLPLAITSLNYWQKKLGKTWFTLHKAVYVVGVLAVVHYWWLVKADVLAPLVYAIILSVLLGVRGFFVWQKKAKQRAI
jgi:methionine sulfoxide reductase heme-binding subunit